MLRLCCLNEDGVVETSGRRLHSLLPEHMRHALFYAARRRMLLTRTLQLWQGASCTVNPTPYRTPQAVEVTKAAAMNPEQSRVGDLGCLVHPTIRKRQAPTLATAHPTHGHSALASAASRASKAWLLPSSLAQSRSAVGNTCRMLVDPSGCDGADQRFARSRHDVASYASPWTRRMRRRWATRAMLFRKDVRNQHLLLELDRTRSI